MLVVLVEIFSPAPRSSAISPRNRAFLNPHECSSGEKMRKSRMAL